MTNLFIPIILATGREGRLSENAAYFVLKQTKKFGIKSELIDVRDFGLTITDRNPNTNQAKSFSTIMSSADGLIIVSPEYNHGYPGELKMVLDQLYKEYNRKPIGICGVSSGRLGGARMVEKLRLVAIELQMVPIRSAVYFSNIRELFDETGNIKDDSYEKRTETFLKELVWYARALKQARENNP